MKILFLFLMCFAEAKEIAITFDDSPRHAKGYFDGPTRAQKLIEGLKKAKVTQAAFFSVSSFMDDEGLARVQAFANAGHIIANHTHTHPNFNRTSAEDYKADFLKADIELSKIKNFEKWFRFPYLREGNDLKKRDFMRQALMDKKYFNAYITVDNSDWYMEEQFQIALKNKVKIDFEKLKKYYVSVLIDSAEYYDQMALQALGRSPKHVFLLHETDLNALFIEDLVNELVKKGWKIITPGEAYKDPISKYQTQKILNYNAGRVAEIANDKGQSFELWPKFSDKKYLDQEFKKQVLN